RGGGRTQEWPRAVRRAGSCAVLHHHRIEHSVPRRRQQVEAISADGMKSQGRVRDRPVAACADGRARREYIRCVVEVLRTIEDNGEALERNRICAVVDELQPEYGIGRRGEFVERQREAALRASREIVAARL